jgi:hypothetical protein
VRLTSMTDDLTQTIERPDEAAQDRSVGVAYIGEAARGLLG